MTKEHPNNPTKMNSAVEVTEIAIQHILISTMLRGVRRDASASHKPMNALSWLIDQREDSPQPVLKLGDKSLRSENLAGSAIALWDAKNFVVNFWAAFVSVICKLL
jgi:hypothetical protein